MRKQAPIAFVPQLGSTIFTRRDHIFTQENASTCLLAAASRADECVIGHNMMRKDGEAHMSERAAMFPAVSPRTVRDTVRNSRPTRSHPGSGSRRRARPILQGVALPLSAES